MPQYHPLFPAGTPVRVASRAVLEEFKRTWHYHHALHDDQLKYADQVFEVARVDIYHMGDLLYVLQGIPGFYWHEQVLVAVDQLGSAPAKDP
jgi:hypothetical protein